MPRVRIDITAKDIRGTDLQALVSRLSAVLENELRGNVNIDVSVDDSRRNISPMTLNTASRRKRIGMGDY